MGALLATCTLTTAVAAFSALWARRFGWQRRLLSWTAGVLVGIGVFWILPEVAEKRGWPVTLAGVSGLLLVLGWINRYVCPICPLCAAGMHHCDTGHAARTHRPMIGSGWPLLLFACVHTFFDGWTIALFQGERGPTSLSALSWGAAIHTLPESFVVGLVAAGFASSRKLALAAVVAVQAAMASGGLLSLWAGGIDSRWAELSAMPACAFLLALGMLNLHQERRLNGPASALRAAAPGFLGTGLIALASAIFAR